MRTPDELPGPRPWPVVGNSLQVSIDHFHLDLEGWAARYGPLYQLRFGTSRVVVLSDSELIRELLKRRPDRVRRQAKMQRIAAELGVDGLFTAEGERWRKQRKLMNAAFAPRQVRSFGPKLIEITERLRVRWQAAAEAGELVDVHADLRRYTIDVTMIVAFGEDVDSLRKGEGAGLRAQLEPLFPGFHRRLRALWPYWRLFELPQDRQLRAQAEALRAEVGRRIAATRARLEARGDSSEPPANLLEAMVLARDEDDPKLRLDDEEIFANALVILLAGEDTTSNSSAWMLDALARDRAVAARLREEVDGVLGEARVAAELEQLERMPYLQGAIHEALRLRSAAPVMFFETLERQRLGELELPAHTLLVALPRFEAVSEGRFAEPERFDPSRWIDEARQADAAHEPKAMLSFGYGPRICPGRALALLELGLVGSMVARNFELEPSRLDAPDERFGFTMSPDQVRLRLRPR